MPTRERRLRDQRRREEQETERQEQEKQLTKAAAVATLTADADDAEDADESDNSDTVTVLADWPELPSLSTASTSEQLAAVEVQLDAAREQEEAVTAHLETLQQERETLVDTNLPALEADLAEAVAQLASLQEENRETTYRLHVFTVRGLHEVANSLESSLAVNEQRIAEAKTAVRDGNEALQRERAFVTQESQRLDGLIAQVTWELEGITTIREGLEAEQRRFLAIRRGEVIDDAEAAVMAAERQLANAEARLRGARVDVQRVYNEQRALLRRYDHAEIAEELCPSAPTPLEVCLLAYNEFLSQLGQLAGSRVTASRERDALINALALIPSELRAILEIGETNPSPSYSVFMQPNSNSSSSQTALHLRNKQAAVNALLSQARRAAQERTGARTL